MNFQLCVLSIAFTMCSANRSESFLEFSYYNKSIQIQLVLPVLNGTIFNHSTDSKFESTTPILESITAISTTDPPHNTFVFNGTQYLFHTEYKENWLDASRYCWNKGMRLVAIYSAEENAWIAKTIKELGYGKDDFWTGGKYWPQRQFKWNDANEIEFVNWADGEPAKGNLTLPNNVHFILLKAAADFKWTNEWFKYDRNYFICKEIVQANTDPLPHSTFMFTGKKFHFNTTFKMSAFAGFSYCYDKRMTLLSIVSKEEDNWIDVEVTISGQEVFLINLMAHLVGMPLTTKLHSRIGPMINQERLMFVLRIVLYLKRQRNSSGALDCVNLITTM
ncbi:macrophage mannose receptor 1-like [Bradysia coprophila]|uniref:macrophage mannose receptor 1-like n=1 Tax=Bradysia coprophila TaxID=38358 RepID=UPI00187DB9BC|nr:macrophage mannose receptor 1-like [Bradysia coprophila]